MKALEAMTRALNSEMEFVADHRPLLEFLDEYAADEMGETRRVMGSLREIGSLDHFIYGFGQTLSDLAEKIARRHGIKLPPGVSAEHQFFVGNRAANWAHVAGLMIEGITGDQYAPCESDMPF